MIALFTDFGRNGPYQGQMHNAIYRIAPHIKVIDLMADAPAFNVKASAHLLAALVNDFDEDTLFLAVVDPGVGSQREASIVCADGYWFVGPNNGLFSVIALRAKDVRWWRITWQPEDLSKTFHGRDLFAPVAAYLALDKSNIDVLAEPSIDANPISEDQPPSVIYVDDFGNIMTSLDGASVPREAQIQLNGSVMSYAATFSESEADQVFWYINSLGLVEFAVNGDNAAKALDCVIGDKVSLI